MADRFQGMDFHNWANRFGVSDAEEESMVSNLLRNLGTTQAQGYNRASDMGAMNNLPLATQLAMQRGVGYQGQQAAGQGIFNIGQYANQANREGQMAAANLMMQNRINQEPSFGEQMLGLLGQVGGSVGMGLGMGWATPTPK